MESRETSWRWHPHRCPPHPLVDLGRGGTRAQRGAISSFRRMGMYLLPQWGSHPLCPVPAGSLASSTPRDRLPGGPGLSLTRAPASRKMVCGGVFQCRGGGAPGQVPGGGWHSFNGQIACPVPGSGWLTPIWAGPGTHPSCLAHLTPRQCDLGH